MLGVRLAGSVNVSFTCGFPLDGVGESSHVVSKLGIVAID
jgi:hypothetical protein